MPSRLQSSLRIYLPSTGCLRSNFSMEFRHCFCYFPTQCCMLCMRTDPSLNCGRQARRCSTNRRLVSSLSAEARVRSQASPCRSFSGQNGGGTSLCPSNLVFLCQHLSTKVSYPFTRLSPTLWLNNLRS